jgi:succinoglycan biosynthesis protein ExoA
MLSTQQAPPAVSAVLVCRNEAGTIEQCLRSLLEQTPPPGGFEILVVDGMSDDGTRMILEQLAAENPAIRILDNRQQITPCGMNLGIRSARGDWIAILGSHSRYATDYLLRCHQVACETGADNVGGTMHCEGKNLVQRAIAAAHHSPFSKGGAAWHNPNFEGPADTVFGGFYKRDLFDRIGYFDESLIRNQDDELNLRLTRAGGHIWLSPKIQSWYSPRSSLSALFKQQIQYGYWKVRVIQKHRLPASWKHLVPGAFILAFLSLYLLSLIHFIAVGQRPQGSGSIYLWIPACLFLLLSCYAAFAGAACVLTAAKSEWKLLPILPFVFYCYHFGYGWGFVRGILDFVVLRRGAGADLSDLTRGRGARLKAEG